MKDKTIWKTPVSVAELNKRTQKGLSSHLGIEFTEVGKDFLTASMPVDERTLQPMGIMHGGASAALCETVASAAGNYCLDQKEQVAVGLEINVNHIKAVKSGKIFATARPLHLGKVTQVWEIKAFDEGNNLTTVSRLTLFIIKTPSQKT